jgi:hypothetical protein
MGSDLKTEHVRHQAFSPGGKMDRATRRGFGTWRAVCACAVALGAARPVWGQTTVPNTFSAGTTISASEVNQNFTALTNAMPSATTAYNYNNGNLSSSAVAIVGVSITPPVDGVVFVTGAVTYTITQTIAGNDNVAIWIDETVGGTRIASCRDVRLGLNTTGGAAQTLVTSPSVSQVFDVKGGTPTTFTLLAYRIAGSNTANYREPTMSVVFLPSRLPCTYAVSATSQYGCY